MKEFRPLHGGQLREIADRFGIPVSKLLDFSANINPEGPPATVLFSLRASLDNPSIIANYPNLDETDLRRSLAIYAGVRPENIAVANGFVPLLDAALEILLIQSCLVPVPAFVEYRRALERARVEMIPWVLPSDSDFSYETSDLLAGSHDAILLANPQNPSGALCSRDVLLRIVEEAAMRSILVLLDEAFIDYSPEASLAGEIDHFPNLIVFRSVTKFFGMAGLRIAYAVANTELCRQLPEAVAPWSICTLASIAARVAVQDGAYVRCTSAANSDRRNRLQADLERCGIHIYPSAANFLLLRLPQSADSQELWERLIREHHMVLRNCANYEALAPGHLRVGVRGDAENKQLAEAISQVLARDERDHQTPGLHPFKVRRETGRSA